jgi:hypothetical protein
MCDLSAYPWLLGDRLRGTDARRSCAAQFVRTHGNRACSQFGYSSTIFTTSCLPLSDAALLSQCECSRLSLAGRGGPFCQGWNGLDTGRGDCRESRGAPSFRKWYDIVVPMAAVLYGFLSYLPVSSVHLPRFACVPNSIVCVRECLSGYHEFDASRTSILRMCDEWRGRREVAHLQRLCFAAGVVLPRSSRMVYTLSADRWRYGASRVQDSASPLYLLSADLAEMVAAHLDKEPPSATVFRRWVQYKTETSDGVTQFRIERLLFPACGFLFGLPLRPRGLGYVLAQMFYQQTRRPGVASQEQAYDSIQGNLAAATVPVDTHDYTTNFSNRQVLVASMCFGALCILQQVWTEFVVWWRPAHALCRCSEVTCAHNSRGHQAGVDISIEEMRDNSASSTSEAESQWKWRTRAQLTAVGMVVSVLAQHLDTS